MSKILITGSEGFIGKHLYNSLKLKGHILVGLDLKNGNDLKNKDYVDSLDEDFDYIFHLAAYNGTKWFYEKPIDVIRDNIFATENILSKFSGKVKKIIFSGTCESYVGSTDFFNYPIPTNEDVPLSIPDPQNLRWSYGGSKLLNEIMVWAYAKEFTQDMLILRYHNVYGPNQVDHFIPDFIARVKQKKYNLYGYEDTRSFIYIDDAVEITERISFDNKSNNLVVNIGTDDEIKILDVAKKIMKIYDIDPSYLELENSPEGSTKRRCPNVDLQNSFIGNYKFTSLQEGLTKIINKL